VLHAIEDPMISRDVVVEVGLEVDAVRRADVGDLTGRAQQGAGLSRLEISPTQVHSAWDVLPEHALGLGYGLVGTFDPTAAAVAAAAWLRGAAELAAEDSGIHWTQVVERADDIEALPHTTPTRVLEALDLGLSPSQVVIHLVSDALTIGRGEMPDNPEDLADDIMAAVQRTRQIHGVTLHDLLPRLTPLDPHRPAPDLLEDLMWGIRGAFLLWEEGHWDLADGHGTEDSNDETAGAQLDDDDDGDAALEEMFLRQLTARMERVDRGTV
jgi:hypothetical protein